ncbi:MAG: hypothetical protein WCB63_09260, partial [Polyangiales bacterium]
MSDGRAWFLSVALLVVATGCNKKADEPVVQPNPAKELEPTAARPATSAAPKGPAEYVGTPNCASCHEAQHQGWL